MFYLSGAINVLLFLIIRPELLLFPRPPEGLAEPEIELAPQGTGPAILSDAAKFQDSSELTSMELRDAGFRNNAAESRISSGRISDYV
jgi:hypothetical protein